MRCVHWGHPPRCNLEVRYGLWSFRQPQGTTCFRMLIVLTAIRNRFLIDSTQSCPSAKCHPARWIRKRNENRYSESERQPVFNQKIG